MVSESKPTPPIVSCSLVHAVSLLNTKAMSSLYSTFFTRTETLTLETVVALHIRYTAAYTASFW